MLVSRKTILPHPTIDLSPGRVDIRRATARSPARAPRPPGAWRRCRRPDVFAPSLAEPPHAGAQVVGTSKDDQAEGALVLNRLYLGVLARLQLVGGEPHLALWSAFGIDRHLVLAQARLDVARPGELPP